MSPKRVLSPIVLVVVFLPESQYLAWSSLATTTSCAPITESGERCLQRPDHLIR
jgi:hypothetical protein